MNEARTLRSGYLLALTLSALLAPVAILPAQDLPIPPGDWPQWGRGPSRNMASDQKGLVRHFVAGRFQGASDIIDLATTENIRWVARLGSESYGNPTVAGGRVYVGTNNDAPRDPRFRGDRSCVYCLDERTGSLIWQLNVPKLGTGMVSDWERVGICSSPAVDEDRVYLVSNRGEVLCLDARGMADGNDGPYQAEARYMADPGKSPVEVGERDADIIWIRDMIRELGVAPHNITSSAVLVVGDRLFVSTSNGIDVRHREIPAPRAPCLISLDKRTGAILGHEASGISQRIFHGNWSSPAYLKTEKVELVIFGGPDGRLYAFEPGVVPDQQISKVLREAWRVDCNPPEYRKKDGRALPYGAREGPSEVLATPVVHRGRVYALIGQEPGSGMGPGNLVCVDSEGKVLWSYPRIHRSMSTVSVADGLLFAADYSGFIHCLDAMTGKQHWVHDTGSHIWGSTLVADGRVFVGSQDGFLVVLPATKILDREQVREFDMTSAVYSSPVVANGVLFVATQTHLFAIAESKE